MQLSVPYITLRCFFMSKLKMGSDGLWNHLPPCRKGAKCGPPLTRVEICIKSLACLYVCMYVYLYVCLDFENEDD